MYFIPPFYTISYVYHLRPYSFTFYVESVLRFREVYSFFGQFLPKKRWHRFFEKRGTDGIRRNRKNGTLKCTVLGTVFLWMGKVFLPKSQKSTKKGIRTVFLYSLFYGWDRPQAGTIDKKTKIKTEQNCMIASLAVPHFQFYLISSFHVQLTNKTKTVILIYFLYSLSLNFKVLHIKMYQYIVDLVHPSLCIKFGAKKFENTSAFVQVQF